MNLRTRSPIAQNRHNALHGPAAATTVKRRNDETLTTDGPFAETREVLGGYYIVDCDNLDDAIEVAEPHPGGPCRDDRNPACDGL